MGLGVIAEAVLRIEHKLDAVIRFCGIPVGPLHFAGTVCPACQDVIDYQVDVFQQVVVRKCKCKTGKLPSTIPLTPVQQQGAQNVQEAANPGGHPVVGPPTAEDRPRGKAR